MNSKRIMDLNIKCETIKPLEKNRIKSVGPKKKQSILRLDTTSKIHKK